MKKLLLFTILIFGLFISAFNTAYAGRSRDIPAAFVSKPIISYSTPQLFTQGVAITSLSPTSTGGAVVSYSASLPAGLSIDPTTGIISGTPTAASSSNTYGITANNAAGSFTFSLTIAVNPSSSVISYSPAIFAFSQNVYGTTATPTNTGGTITSWSSSPALPAGLSFATDTSGTIVGTPTTLQSGQLYTITATSASGSNSCIIMITVSNASSLAYDWTAKGSNTDWTTVANWNYNGTTATSYPGQNATSGSNTNIVRFGVTGSSISKLPTVSTTPPNSIASIEFGSLISGSPTLAFTNSASLSLTGNFTIDGGGSIKIKLSGSTANSLNIGGDFYAGTGSTFTNNGCPITIYGNFTSYTSSSGVDFGTALLTFNSGNGSYKLKSYKATTFNNVLFTGSGVALIQKLTGGAGVFYLSSTGTMTFSGSTMLNITSGNLTLKSDASGSATIAAIPSTCKINGTVNVQRYISGTRGWRLLSSPVNTGTTDSYNNTIISLNYLKNSIYISGLAGTAAGFDWTGNPSLALYREDVTPDYTHFVTSNYEGIAGLLSNPYYPVLLETGNFSIPQANGYQVFIRGDRSTGTATQEQSSSWAFTSVTLTASGNVNQGTIAFKSWHTPGSTNLSYLNQDPTLLGFNLVGNPYPSSIDWTNFSNTLSSSPIYGYNVGPEIYSYNFIKKTFATYSGGVSVNGGSNVIGSGQGFFVVATGANATLTFNESAKTSSSYSGVATLMSKQPVTASVLQFIKLRMMLDSLNDEETALSFNSNAKNTFNINEDAPYKAGGSKVTLNSLSQDSVALAINQLPLKSGQPVKLNINASASGTYILSLAELQAIPQMYDIWLKDKFVGDSVNLRKTNTYSFTIDKSNPATFGKSRFSVIVKQDSAYAYKLLSFTGVRVGNSSHVQTQWNTLNEENYTNFTVERSNDAGNTFAVVGGMQGTGAGAYSLTDKNAVDGQNLYRLKSEDINSNITYSQLVEVMISGNGTDKIQLFPNPANSMINVDVLDKTNEASSYIITVSNSTGFIVKQVTSSQPKWQANISDLMPGTYIVRVIDNKAQSFVGESKFIKL